MSTGRTDSVGQIVDASGKMPNWRHRISRGLNATTTFRARDVTLEYRPGHLYFGKWCPTSNRFGHYQYDGDLSLSFFLDSPDPPSSNLDPQTNAEALSRAVKDARSKQTHFRGGNFLAELRDTIRGLRNPAKGIRNLTDTYHRNAKRRAKRAAGRSTVPTTKQGWEDFERSNPRSAGAVQRALADSWLENQFGWAPLISDTVSAYHALRALSARVPLVRFSGVSSRVDPPIYDSDNRGHDLLQINFTHRVEREYDVRYYGAVKVETSSPPSGQAIEEFGVRARDFVPAVWEAIPYSFMVDYFSNIGDIIECVSFPRSDLAWMARTFRNHHTHSVERVAVVNTTSFPSSGSIVVWAFTPPLFKWRHRRVNRTAYSGSLIPRLQFEIPGSKNWKKWLNIAALARLRTL